MCLEYVNPLEHLTFYIKYDNHIGRKSVKPFGVTDIITMYEICHTATELNLGLKKIAIKTEHAEMWRMSVRSF